MSVLVFSSLAVGPPRMPRMRMVVVRWNWGMISFRVVVRWNCVGWRVGKPTKASTSAGSHAPLTYSALTNKVSYVISRVGTLP